MIRGRDVLFWCVGLPLIAIGIYGGIGLGIYKGIKYLLREDVYVLKLNDMRSPKIEMSETVAWSESKEALEKYLASEQVEPYEDGRWRKFYKTGGPLEWCNTPYSGFGQGVQLFPTLDQMLDRAKVTYENHIAHLKEDYANFKNVTPHIPKE